MTKRRMEIAVQAEQHSICNFWKCKIFINQNMSSIIYSSSFCWDIYGMYILRTQVRLLATQLTDLGPFSRLYPKGLRVLGLLLADGAPTVQWGGGRLFDGSTNILDESTKFFYGNCCSSGTESRKIIPKVGNERSLQGLRTGRCPKLGSYGKYRTFWPKTEILGPK